MKKQSQPHIAARLARSILLLLVLLAGLTMPRAANADSRAVPDLSRAWFTPTLTTDHDPVCAAVLSGVRANFESDQPLELWRPVATVAFSGLTAMPLPGRDSEPNDRGLQLVRTDGWHKDYVYTVSNRPRVYVRVRRNPGCGGGCESETLTLSDQSIANAGNARTNDAATEGATAPFWTLYGTPDGEHYWIGIVDERDLRVYRTTAIKEQQLACAINIAPNDPRKSTHEAIQAPTQSLQKFLSAIGNMAQGAGQCGTLATAHRWVGYRRNTADFSLYRPWALQRRSEDLPLSERSENSAGDYSRISLQLELWSLNGIRERRS